MTKYLPMMCKVLNLGTSTMVVGVGVRVGVGVVLGVGVPQSRWAWLLTSLSPQSLLLKLKCGSSGFFSR